MRIGTRCEMRNSVLVCLVCVAFSYSSFSTNIENGFKADVMMYWLIWWDPSGRVCWNIWAVQVLSLWQCWANNYKQLFIPLHFVVLLKDHPKFSHFCGPWSVILQQDMSLLVPDLFKSISICVFWVICLPSTSIPFYIHYTVGYKCYNWQLYPYQYIFVSV